MWDLFTYETFYLPDRRKYKGDFLEIRYDLFIDCKKRLDKRVLQEYEEITNINRAKESYSFRQS